MFRYLNPARIFRTGRRIGPTESPITDPTTTETQMKIAASEYRTKRFRIRDQESIEEESVSPDGRKMGRKKKRTLKKLRLRSSDGVLFEVDMEVIVGSSERIRAQVEGHGHGHGHGGCYCPGEVIGVPDVASDAMAVAIDYCEKRAVDEENELKDWVLGLFRADQSAFFDLTLAAYHLKIKSLLDLTSQVMADMIRGKSPMEIKNILNIQGDTSTTLLPRSAHGV